MISTMGDDPNIDTDLTSFYKLLIQPESIQRGSLIVNQNQVAGHAGFYSLEGSKSVCLKPFNTECVRGRREHLFYQLMEYFRRQPKEVSTVGYGARLYYRSFKLLNPPATTCNCAIDGDLFKLISQYIPTFHHVRHLVSSDDTTFNRDDYMSLVYSENLICPCYGRNPTKKSSCSRDYEKTDFLCLEDLTSHCKEPCIVDIKIGPITYDPMAIKEKVLEQSSKYRQLREFGFRILGMKVGSQTTDKSHGKALETTEQVLQALESYLEPLTTSERRHIIIRRILSRLEGLTEIFSKHNSNQLKFFSSSLLLVYDMSAVSDTLDDETSHNNLADSVRVYMIDFAHVFHVHHATNKQTSEEEQKPSDPLDTNYMFGLNRLISFFTMMDRHPQPPSPRRLPPPPPEWHHP